MGTITSGTATSVNLTDNTTFTLTCINSAGSDEATVEIATTPAAVPPAIDSLSASPNHVISGQATNVAWSWSYSNAPTPTPTCTIDQGVGTLTSGTTTSVNLTDNTTFTLTCTNSAGSDEATVEITTSSTFTLIKSVDGTGGSISGGDSSPYAAGTNVTLTALPSNGYLFDKWSVNGTTDTTNPITITMDNDKTVIAYFRPNITQDILVDYEISRVCVPDTNTGKPDVVYQSLGSTQTLVKDHVYFNCAFDTFFKDATDLEKIEVSFDSANASKQIFFNYDIPTSSLLEDFTMLMACNCYYPINLTLNNFADMQDYTMNYDVAPIKDSTGAVVATLYGVSYGDCDIPSGETFTITEVETVKHAINKSDYLSITGCIMSGGSFDDWAKDSISGGSYIENSSNGTLTVSIDEPSISNVRKRTIFIELPDWDASKNIPEIVINLIK